ncbi:MAG: hypothetical protein EOP18_08845 [Rhizobiaceae bacterium]|nr:MAG: hypothetical protein EOP18_08845 [Rhizobiaceae bacterium]
MCPKLLEVARPLVAIRGEVLFVDGDDVRGPGTQRADDARVGQSEADEADVAEVRRQRIDRSHPRPEHIIAVYEKYFTSNGYEWSSDLEELGAYHAAFEAQMAAWHRLFPGRIYEIDLMKLRADRKGEINRLLDYCGLGWSEACMAEACSEPQIGDWPIERIIANRDAHHRAWRAARPDLWP